MPAEAQLTLCRNLASQFGGMGYNELAEECLQYAMQVALTHGPGEAPLLHLEFGRLLDLKGDWRGALHSYEKALGLPQKHNVDTGRILNGIGLQYYALGNWDKARDYYRRAMDLTDSAVGRYCAQVNTAVLLGERGRIDEALSLERALLTDLTTVDDEFGYYCVQSNMLYKYAMSGNEAAFDQLLDSLTQVLDRPILRRLRFGVTDSRFIFALRKGRLGDVEHLLGLLRRLLGDGSAVSSTVSEGWIAIREAMFLRHCGQPRIGVARLTEALTSVPWDALSRVSAEYELALCLKEAEDALAGNYALRALAGLKQLGYDRREIDRRRGILFERTTRGASVQGADLAFMAFVGRSGPAIRVRATLAKVAPTDATVLILGESGTGKSFVAKLIHDASPRRGGPFVRFDCTCHEEGLMESLLFGHRRGSFTGALSERKGLVQLSTDGSLFIDEVADLPLGLQGKLLTLLEEGVYRSIGSGRTERANVRFLVATNKDLEVEVREKRFREDLVFRLGDLKIIIPPLRKRSEDIPTLAASFLASLNKRFGTARRLSASAWDGLCVQEWPGNARQLQKVLERAVVLSDDDEMHLADLGLENAGEVPARVRTLDEIEREHIVQVLSNVAWNRSRAARLLGIKRTTLYSRMMALGI